MNAYGQIPFRSEAELREKNFLLRLVSQARLPSVQADFADRARSRIEKCLQVFQPVWRAFVLFAASAGRVIFVWLNGSLDG